MQGVLVFATEAARNSAITSPQEGQFAFTKDTNSLWYYSGSAWVASGATGDIEGVTAGTGISGGGTSGTVTITNDMATTITASGDIVVGTGSGTYDNLPIGTTGQILTADTTVSPYKVKWASPAGGGKVLQVVQASTATAVTVSSTTYTDTGLSGTITPTSSSSKILVLVNQQVYILATSGGTLTGSIQLLRGATVVYEPQSNEQLFGLANAPAGRYDLQTMVPLTYLDSPATTSATTYKLQGALLLTSGGNQLNFQQDNTGRSVITLIEIGA
jgi:hypothetical protein